MRPLSHLTETEAKHVRTALQHLRRRIGMNAGWYPIASALGVHYSKVKETANGRTRVTPDFTFALANLLGVSVGDLLEGRVLPGACPKCGHVPDFSDEATIVDDDEPTA